MWCVVLDQDDVAAALARHFPPEGFKDFSGPAAIEGGQGGHYTATFSWQYSRLGLPMVERFLLTAPQSMQRSSCQRYSP